MKNFILKGLVMLTTIGGVMIFSTNEANAQRRSKPRRVVVVRHTAYLKNDVERVIRRVEERTDKFVSQLNKSLDRSSLNGSRREDAINQRTRDLESATDELRREFDRRDTWQENRDEVRKCLDIASDIDRTMRRSRFNRQTETNWANLRSELNALARVYGVPQIGASYRR